MWASIRQRNLGARPNLLAAPPIARPAALVRIGEVVLIDDDADDSGRCVWDQTNGPRRISPSERKPGRDKPNEFRPENPFSGNLDKNAKTQVRSPASRPPPLPPSIQWILDPPGPSRQSTQYLHVPAALGRSSLPKSLSEIIHLGC